MSDLSSSLGNAARAALSGSRFASRRRPSTFDKPTKLYQLATTFFFEESGFDSRCSSPSLSTNPNKSNLSKINLLGEPSSDSSGSLSMFSDNREDVNDLLATGQYAALLFNRVSREQYFTEYSSRIPRSLFEMDPCSARRSSYISVAELEVNLIVKHLDKPKYFPFPAYKDMKSPALRTDRWAPHLIFSAQITSLYSHEDKEILSDWMVQGIG